MARESGARLDSDELSATAEVVSTKHPDDLPETFAATSWNTENESSDDGSLEDWHK